jgi:hypothetical protein
LDFVNLSFGGSGRDYFQALMNGTAISQQRETYYWQIMQEDPRINRLNAGFFLWNTGLSGVFPYVYQHIGNNPYDDFGVWYAGNPAYRHHLVTYPSQEGPVPTMQWESLREGIDDVRYLTTWQYYKDLVKSIDPVSAQDSQQIIDALLANYTNPIYTAVNNDGTLPPVTRFAVDRETIRDEILRLINLLPPVLDAIPGQTAAAGLPLSFTVTAADPDHNALTLTGRLANGDPLSILGARFVDDGDGTGRFEWTPDAGQTGTHQLAFAVTDANGLTDTASVLINVYNVSLSPHTINIPTAQRRNITLQTANTTEALLEKVKLKFTYPEQVLISNLQTSAGATEAESGDTELVLEWEKLPPGTVMTATFDVSSATAGTYTIVPKKIKYELSDGSVINGSSNNVLIDVK